ncbi:MAG: hypothetical protein C5B47_00150 [Verrucomicrobia bacterium]|nr:MAG: hypothetical protein C5B47_00150 [Verrucomicrobiota bacterium]
MLHYINSYHPHPSFAGPNYGGNGFYHPKPPQFSLTPTSLHPGYPNSQKSNIYPIIIEKSFRPPRETQSTAVKPSPIEIQEDIDLFTLDPNRGCLPYFKENNGKYFLIPTSGINKDNLPNGTLMIPQGNIYYLKKREEAGCPEAIRATAEYAVLSRADFVSLKKKAGANEGSEPERESKGSRHFSSGNDSRSSYNNWQRSPYRLQRQGPSYQQQYQGAWNHPNTHQPRPYYWQRSGV